MKKIIILIIFLMIVVGCAQDYPGEYRMVCESDYQYNLYGIEEIDDFEKVWKQTETIDSVDNYIVSFEQKFEFLLKEPALNFLNSQLDGDKEALLEEYVNLAIGNSKKFYDNIDNHNIEYFDDKIVVTTYDEYDIPEKSWQTIIIPEEANFKSTYRTYSKTSDCKVVKK